MDYIKKTLATSQESVILKKEEIKNFLSINTSFHVHGHHHHHEETDPYEENGGNMEHKEEEKQMHLSIRKQDYQQI